jgi:predicted Zn-dependent protease
MTDRVATFRAMVDRAPDNALARFGLANELLKVADYAGAVEQLDAYLARYDDEGNGWLKLADACHRLGRLDEARTAIARGLAAAERFGHQALIADLEAKHDEIDDG